MGKTLFLITDSRYDYANLLCSHVLGENWQELFDIIVVHAQKSRNFIDPTQPFTKTGPNIPLEEQSEPIPIGETVFKEIVGQGNKKLVTDMLIQATGKKEPKILYLGDSLSSDILSIRKAEAAVQWDTGFVCQEL